MTVVWFVAIVFFNMHETKTPLTLNRSMNFRRKFIVEKVFGKLRGKELNTNQFGRS